MEETEQEELLRLTRENNKILRSLRSAHRFAAFSRFFYWIIIIGIAVASYYYLTPYLSKIMELYNESSTTLDKLKEYGGSLPDFSQFNFPQQ